MLQLPFQYFDTEHLRQNVAPPFACTKSTSSLSVVNNNALNNFQNET